MVEDDLDVAKVATLDANINRDVFSVFVWSLAENVVIELDSSLDNEEDLFSGVVLPIERVVFVDFHLTEKGKHLPDELLILVV